MVDGEDHGPCNRTRLNWGCKGRVWRQGNRDSRWTRELSGALYVLVSLDFYSNFNESQSIGDAKTEGKSRQLSYFW